MGNGWIVPWSLKKWNYGEQSDEAVGWNSYRFYRELSAPHSPSRVDRQFYFIMANGTCVDNPAEIPVRRGSFKPVTVIEEVTLSGPILSSRPPPPQAVMITCTNSILLI